MEFCFKSATTVNNKDKLLLMALVFIQVLYYAYIWVYKYVLGYLAALSRICFLFIKVSAQSWFQDAYWSMNILSLRANSGKFMLLNSSSNRFLNNWGGNQVFCLELFSEMLGFLQRCVIFWLVIYNRTEYYLDLQLAPGIAGRKNYKPLYAQ